MGEMFAGRYELVDPIGRGGVGAVWRAWDHRRRRYVAAKVLQQSDAHTLLRFVREQALRIDHPHVLAPTSWAADDDKVLFTMDLVGGGSLSHLVGDHGPLPPRYACVLLDQLLAGLGAVHAENVVHRDIKPANILLEATGTGQPHLRLSDFGIAMRKGEPRLTETNFVVGTPGYFAPEQLRGADPDFPADLYATGLVALYLLTGTRPHSEALLEAYTGGVPPAPDGVPQPLWQVIATLLHPDPAHRFRTAVGVRRALADAVELLPELTPDQMPEITDRLGPLPPGYGPDGPTSPVGGPATSAPGTPPPGAPATSGTVPTTPLGDAGASPGGAGRSTAGAGSPGGTLPQPDTDGYPLPPPTPTPVAPPAAGPGGAAAPPPTPPGGVPTGVTAHATQALGVPARRPGPPPAVAIPMLVVALLCIGVGVWALAQG